MLENIFNLTGRVIVITGAAGLLGQKHAEAVACFGGTPILLDLSKKLVDDLADKLNLRYNTGALGFAIDITDENLIIKNADHLIKVFGKIDGLVNNAANNPKLESNNLVDFSRLENFPLKAWWEDISVGLTGAFLCSKHYGKKISFNSNGGSIINVSSDLGLIAPDQRLYKKNGIKKSNQPVKPVTYSVVKTGIIGLTRYLSSYWNEEGVRCNAICPGGVENGQPSDFLNKVTQKIPMNRLASKGELQGTLIWLLSDASSYQNGSVIPVDGGRTSF